MRDPSAYPKPSWHLSQEAFDALLASLESDRVHAGEQYELLRHKLMKFFGWRGAHDPAAWADETLNRVARRIEQGEQVPSVPAYAAGVARMVWREAARQQDRAHELDDRTPAPAVDTEDADAAARFECLDMCLEALPTDQRELVLAYFAEEKGAKIDNRKQMAARLGIEINALRIRVHRIRTKLERCVKACVSRREAG